MQCYLYYCVCLCKPQKGNWLGDVVGDMGHRAVANDNENPPLNLASNYSRYLLTFPILSPSDGKD